ncbi:uncharacterized protein At1g01500-like [Rutidosis leptorrhynchoides]|uniref:uncharacterized protein At1g01500-like n=1 Tax=Rutidosis leptorrhynchoides TaxID=125765 RepID=UPI003A99168D
MEQPYRSSNGNVPTENGHVVLRHSPRQKISLHWLDIKVFYVRVSRSEIDDSTPESLSLNNIPLDPDTLLEVNGVRASIYSDGASTLLRRDRLDKKSEEVTYVSTDSIRITGSVKFEVFDKDLLVLSGVLELCNSNENNGGGQTWNINCESDIIAGSSFLKGRHANSPDSASPAIEVYVAGCFDGTPIILTRTLQLRKKHMRKGMLDSIPEYDPTEGTKSLTPRLAVQVSENQNYKPESENYNHHLYAGGEYLEGEDGELSWFNAGVRVGVGIGLSVCIGVGIGVGLLVKTYQSTTRNFRRRLL